MPTPTPNKEGEGQERPERPHPNESENQPGFEPGREHDGRRDEISSPPSGDIDPAPKQAEDEKRRAGYRRGSR